MRGHGHHVRAKAQAPDPLSALDAVVAKLEHQLHRLKERLVDHGHGRVRNGRAAGRGAGAAVAVAPAGMAASTEIPVRSKRFEVVPMSVQEAAFQMELLSHPFFVFVREDTGATAVVYRREQGGVGLIEVESRSA
jgi:putative sigma-54 modulation protein